MRRDILKFLAGGKSSASVALIVLLAVSFLGFYVAQQGAADFAFFPEAALMRPWTLLTYFLVGNGFVGLVFACLWIFTVGVTVERDLGSLKFLAVWLIFTILPALSVWMGSSIFNEPGLLHGTLVPLAALIIIWGSRYPTLEVNVVFCRVQAKWVALFSAGMVLFATSPKLAIFAALPLILAWLFGSDRLPFLPYAKQRIAAPPSPTQTWRKNPKEDESFYFDAEKRKLEREERDRLRKLFESSVKDEGDD